MNALFLSIATVMNLPTVICRAPWTRFFVSIGAHTLLGVANPGENVTIELGVKMKVSSTREHCEVRN